MFRASDSQESLDMIKAAYEVSETYEVPVLFRMTTRVCHSKSLVKVGEPNRADAQALCQESRQVRSGAGGFPSGCGPSLRSS